MIENTIRELAKRLPDVALRVSGGKVEAKSLCQPTLPRFQQQIPVIEIARPETDWAATVDRIEATVAKDNDVLEYGDNLALRLLGLWEMREMLRAFAIPTGQQTEYGRMFLKNQKFLVVGTGPGREVAYLASHGGEVIGIDATKEYVDLAAQRIENTASVLGRHLDVALFQQLAENFQYQEYCFDGISCLFGVINHVEAWQETIKKMAAGLRPKGRLVIEKYGTNDALVFKLLKQNKIPYQPAILQRRDPDGHGIMLGNDGAIFPTHFPDDQQFTQAITEAGLTTQKRIGFLRIAALFPFGKEPNDADIQQFLAIVKEIDTEAFNFIKKFKKPEEILLAAFEYDLLSQRGKKEPVNVDDFAYVFYVAEKPGIKQ